MTEHRHQHGERGAAIILALLIMTVLATLAVSAISNHWAQQRNDAIAPQILQHEALLLAGQQWAHAILIEDARHTAIDHLQEDWAQPFPPTSLSALFNANNDSQWNDAALSVRIEDLTGKWNILSLRRASDDSQHMVLARKIAAMNGLPEDTFIRLLDAVPPERNANWYGGSANLRSPQDPEACLRWLGFTPELLDKTQAMITCLPNETAFNINTVSPFLLELLVAPGIAQDTLIARDNEPFSSLAEVVSRLNVPDTTFPCLVFGRPGVGWTVRSSWFAIHTDVRLDGIVWRTTQTVQRVGNTLQTLSTVTNNNN